MSETNSPITPLTPAETAAAEARALHEGELHKLLTAVDVLLNVAFGGKPDMTISTRAALAAQHGSEVGIVLSKFLSEFQADHGALAAAGDTARAEAVEQAAAPAIDQPPDAT